jgi:lipid-binding SYLF domain-containing protein
MKKLSSPLPQALPKECQKAVKILQSFVSNTNGLDGVIPRHVLTNAKGFAIFTVLKAGLFLSARAGSGIVIARLHDGSWSAPSAIGTAGMGFGGQAGAEMTEFLVVLNSQAAVQSFMSAGSLTLGGNMSIAVGPLGRNGEASGSLNTKGRVAAMYSYSKTKGLFGGISIEGSVIIERQDANYLAYHEDVSAKMLLTGVVPPPPWVEGLIQALNACMGGVPNWVQDEDVQNRPGEGYAFSGQGSTPNSSTPGSGLVRGFTRRMSSPFTTPSQWGKKKTSYFPEDDEFSNGTGASPYTMERSKSPPTNGSSDKNRDTHSRHKSLPSSKSPAWNDQRSPSSYFQNGTNSKDMVTDTDEFGRVAQQQPPAKVDDLLDSTNDQFAIFSLAEPMTKKPATTPRFETHFDSDFDPLAPSLTNTTSPKPFNPPPTSTSTFTYDTYQASSPFNSLPVFPLSQPSSPPPATPTTVDLVSVDGGEEENSTKDYDHNSSKPRRSLSVKKGLRDPIPNGASRAIALFNFTAQEAGDLSFKKGDIIVVTKKSDSTNDWYVVLIIAPDSFTNPC